MDSNGHNGIKGLRVLLSGPAADGVATMLAHQPAISLVRPTGLAETQASADVALHVLESSSVHGELPHARELRVPLILAAIWPTEYPSSDARKDAQQECEAC